MSNECRTRLIADTPADADAFGSHKRIAATLADLIRSESGGKAIGLQGGWGTGKSTVVNLLRTEMNTDPGLVFVVFDAWAHEGDPLRRSFLEALTSSFVNAGWISKHKWTEKMDLLSKRKRITDTKTTPRLTTLAKRLLVAGLLVPLGFALLSDALRDPIYLLPGAGRDIAWQFMVGLVLALAPLLLLICDRGRRKSSDAWAILMRGSTSTSRTEATETPEPTSVEFQAIFVELMADALNLDDSRQLVLVVDNLDRVAPDDALAIWSSLRTFFLIGECRELGWFDRFWIIVPYDSEALERLWPTAENSKPMAESFIGKTFQLRLSVPPVLLSNWRSFLDACLREAFPDHDPAEFHVVYRLYATCAIVPGQSPTPRNLKLYVNDIGGLHRQWQHEIPLSDLAYFVLLQQKGTNVVQGLKEGSMLPVEVHDLVSFEISDNLAALAFNTTAAEARQIMLQGPVTRALEQAGSKALADLESSPGLWETLEAMDFSQWSEKEPLKLANAARCLCESGVTGRVECAMKAQTIAHLKNAVLQVNGWRPFGDEMGRGLSSICRLCPSPEVAQHLILTLTAREQGDSAMADPGEWTTTVVTLLEALEDIHVLAPEKATISMPTAGSDTLAVCCRLAECDKGARFWSAFQVDVAAGTLDQAISDAIADDTKTRGLVDAMPVLRGVGAQVNWKAAAALVHAKLAIPSVLPASSVASLLDLLVDMKSIYPAAQEKISSLAANGYLFHHLQTVYPKATGANADVAARCLVLQVAADASMAPPLGNGDATAGHQLANQLVSVPSVEFASAVNSYLRTMGQTRILFKIVVLNPALGPLVRACLRLAADSDEVEIFLPPDAVVDHWAIVSEVPIEDARIAFGNVLREKTGLVSFLVKHEFSVALGSLYALLVRAGAASDLGGFCAAGLNRVDLDVWLNELVIENSLAELVVDLAEAGVEFQLGHNYKDALAQHAKNTAVSQAVPKYLGPKHWSELLSRLRSDSRRVFRRELLDVAIATDGDLPDVFFEYYGGELAHSDALVDNRAVSGLFTSLVRRGNVRGMRWMIEFFADEPSFLSSIADADAVGDFRRRIKDLIALPPEGEDDGIAAIRLDLADAVGVPRHDDSSAAGAV